MTTYVYLAYSADGDLLYIGHTNNVAKRMACHRSVDGWPHEVARIEVEEYETATEARWVERLYIADLEPIHNRQGNPAFGPDPFASEVSA